MEVGVTCASLRSGREEGESNRVRFAQGRKRGVKSTSLRSQKKCLELCSLSLDSQAPYDGKGGSVASAAVRLFHFSGL